MQIFIDITSLLIILFLNTFCNREYLYQDLQLLNNFLFSKDNIHMPLILDISSSIVLAILKRFQHISIFS